MTCIRALLVLLGTLILNLQAVNPSYFDPNIGIRQLTEHIISANAIPVYGPNNPAINQPGVYAVANDIDGALTIESDNVTLSLNNYRVKGNAEYGILVDGKNHIVIQNGSVGPDDAGDSAVGIKINNARDIVVENCALINSAQCLAANTTYNLMVNNCRAAFFTQLGFHASSCTTTSMQNCTAATNSPTNEATGFKVENCTDSAMQNCTTTGLNPDKTGIGFWIKNPQYNRVQSCTVDSITTGSYAQGILIEQSAATEPIDISGGEKKARIHTRKALVRTPNETLGVSDAKIQEGTDKTVVTEVKEVEVGTTEVVVTHIEKGVVTEKEIISGESNAYESKVAIDPEGNEITVWTELVGSVYQIFASNYNQDIKSWNSGINISHFVTTPQNASSPAIAFDPDGNAFAVWVEKDSNYKDQIYTRRYDATSKTWEQAGENATATKLSNSGNNAYAPTIAFDGSGYAIALWAEKDNSDFDSVWASNYNAGSSSWSSTPQKISADTQTNNPAMVPVLAVHSAGTASAGTAMAVWHQYSDSDMKNQVYACFFDGSTWKTAQNISNYTYDGMIPGVQNATLPTVTYDTSGKFFALWTETNSIWDPISQVFARQAGADGSWQGLGTENSATNICNFVVPHNAQAQSIAACPSKVVAAWIEEDANGQQAAYARKYEAEWIGAGEDNTATQLTEFPQAPITLDTLIVAMNNLCQSTFVWNQKSVESDIPTVLMQSNPVIQSPNHGDSVFIDNTISNIHTTVIPNNGIGIYAAQVNDIYAKNKVYTCDIAYKDVEPAAPVQTGYDGTNFMYNVAI